MSPGGSGYFTCKQNMKLVTTKFKSEGLHEKHVVATWNLGNHLSIMILMQFRKYVDNGNMKLNCRLTFFVREVPLSRREYPGSNFSVFHTLQMQAVGLNIYETAESHTLLRSNIQYLLPHNLRSETHIFCNAIPGLRNDQQNLSVNETDVCGSRNVLSRTI